MTNKAIRLLRLQVDCAQLIQGSHAGQLGTCGRGEDPFIEWASCLPKALGSLNR